MDGIREPLNMEFIVQPRFQVGLKLESISSSLQLQDEMTYLTQLIFRQHIILIAFENRDWDGIDILQIRLDEERGMESDSNVDFSWGIVIR
jgi:hypothetical protein